MFLIPKDIQLIINSGFRRIIVFRFKIISHYGEDTFITQSNIIPNSFDNTKHNDILDAKNGLTEMKI